MNNEEWRRYAVDYVNNDLTAATVNRVEKEVQRWYRGMWEVAYEKVTDPVFVPKIVGHPRPEAFVRGSVRNAVRDYIDKKGKLEQQDETWLDERVDEWDGETAVEARDWLEEAPDEVAQVVELLRTGMTQAEVAAEIGVTDRTVRTRRDEGLRLFTPA